MEPLGDVSRQHAKRARVSGPRIVSVSSHTLSLSDRRRSLRSASRESSSDRDGFRSRADSLSVKPSTSFNAATVLLCRARASVAGRSPHFLAHFVQVLRETLSDRQLFFRNQVDRRRQIVNRLVPREADRC